ncbi:hypothetical protein PYJP_15420 [Pyrofollis japonicus]|uniref:DUF47 domain-containing protein n=1 Tax=Pyrofollis japonicus TaxID=3060460 RepID=UPI00295ABDA8|nr:DUF47 family protein [Pyrofollis japonicus]BEP18190.1 hypothetical protein PYJP_15420 [Pyrofollis japonicus]
MAEYYDYDLERRKQRSLAEENLNEQLLGMVRTVRQPVMLVYDAISRLSEGKTEELGKLYEEVKSLKDRIENMKEDILSYLARLGDLLVTNNLYRDIFLNITRVAQVIEGITYRAYLLASNVNKTFSREILDDLIKMTDKIRQEYLSLENAVENLTTNPKKSYEISQNVSSVEDEIDSLYRKLTYSIYRELRDDLVTLMLFRDIIDMVEDLADLLRDLSEDIKFLALFQAMKA